VISEGETNEGVEAEGVWVVVPYKGPAGSKSRLSRLLHDHERERLSLELLDGVLDAALGSARVARVIVMLPASSPLPERDDPRLELVRETAVDGVNGDSMHANSGLNRALIQAQAAAETAGVSQMLILPSDLPLLGVADVDALVSAAETASVVIAPDREAEGTNALLLNPPSALVPSFGESSFERHLQMAESAGLPLGVVKRWGLALDLDTPADILRLYAIGEQCRAAKLLQSMGATSHAIAGLGLGEPVQARRTTI
jgi:2-phospho-L-lactate/phosphoenolpyruvate guanylyltransferase